jgi:hypothetical protein
LRKRGFWLPAPSRASDAEPRDPTSIAVGMRWLRRRLRRFYSPSTSRFHGRWVGAPPPIRGRAWPPVTPWGLPAEWLSNERWNLPLESQKALVAEVKSFESSLGPVSVSGSREKGSGLEVAGALMHALQSAFVDGVAVDRGCLSFATGLDRVLEKPAHLIHEFETILQHYGMIIKMQLTESAHTFLIDHAVSQVHSINDTYFCLDHAHITGHFSVPWLSVLNIARQEFGRYMRNECTLLQALKQFLIRAGAKTGIGFLMKKACIVVASWFWSTTAALILGPVGLFAGLLVGTELGEFLRRLGLQTAYNALRAREERMKLSLVELLQAANGGAEQARQDFLGNYKRVTEQWRKLAAAALARQKAQEDRALEAFIRVYVEELERIQFKQFRARRRLGPGYVPNVYRHIHLGPTTLCAEEFQREFDEAQDRLKGGWQALGEPDLRWRIALIMRWLTDVDVYSSKLDCAIKALHVSLQSLETQRLTTLKHFTQRQEALGQACAGRFERQRTGLGETLKKGVATEIKETDERIEDVLSEARKIGAPITIVRPWPAP